MRPALSDAAERRIAEILTSLPPLTDHARHQAVAILASVGHRRTQVGKVAA